MIKLKNKLSGLARKVDDMNFSNFADKLENFKWSVGQFFRKTPPFSWTINARWWLQHRLLNEHKYHLVDTKLPPGYYESDERMFHACFSILVDFVEKEQSWMHLILSDDKIKKVPWWQSLRAYNREHARELGVAHLDWEMTLIMENNHDGMAHTGTDWQIFHKGTQGWSGKEIKELYVWYKDIYPKRFNNKKYSYQLEEFYLKETTDMLIRLMNVRNRLWT